MDLFRWLKSIKASELVLFLLKAEELLVFPAQVFFCLLCVDLIYVPEKRAGIEYIYIYI